MNGSHPPVADRRNLARAVWHKLFTLEQWRIGIAENPVAAFLAAPGSARFSWINPRSRREILADPFAVERDGRLEIFAERLVHGQSRGTLVRISPGSGEAVPLPLPAGEVHLSYPFTVKDAAGDYVVPEQAHSGRLAFYPLTRTGAPAAAPAAVLDGFDVIDPTLLHHDGRWWLFCGRLGDRPNEALYLYSAEHLLGPYTAHPDNPVVVDRGRARPAGRIVKGGGKLLRPGQDCSTTYGGAITLSEIEVLTPAAYREKPVGQITPAMIAGAWPGGVHTLEHAGDHVLIDNKRFVFHPLAFAVKLLDRIAGRAV